MQVSTALAAALSARLKAAFNAFVLSRGLKWELARIDIQPDPQKGTTKVEIEIDEPEEYKPAELAAEQNRVELTPEEWDQIPL